MIAISDAVLILVSAAALGSGLYRWQSNLEQVSLANSRPAASVETSPQNTVSAGLPEQQLVSASGDVSGSTEIQRNLPTSDSSQGQIVVVEPSPTVTINVADDSATTASNDAIVDARPYGSYTVQPGDSLSLIAEQNATSVRVLQEINELDGTLITIGQELRYPLPVN